ncbi:MAG TPA: YceI family protein, partial [Geminicoccaceae bacterium]|nr:YceI family protein [Geminicoccaceae bacterium]
MTAPRRHGFRPARAASLSLAALLVASAAAAGAAAAAERYLIDPEHRHVAFQVGHMNFYKAGVDQITGAYTLSISATGSLKRSDFGMTYALQDDLVGDQVDLML